MDNFPPANSGTWTTGLCGCFDDFCNCCITCWCPCIPVGQYVEVLDRGATGCVTGAALYTLLTIFTGCPCIYTCGYRKRLRHKYGLPESPCADILTDWCCQPCSICQMIRELKNRGVDPSLGWDHVKSVYDQPVGTKAPYQQQMTQ